MRPANLDDAANAREDFLRPGCEELLRYAIDCLTIKGTAELSPRDRARLASAAAVLEEISQDLETGAGKPDLRPTRTKA
ncbi:hypothetical protein [Mesorhizobium comanense]|uniref:hypothetical protein n=1 Tax=Mesorhizobium comanense TaxID=2502215 RepID=UPI0014853493|nr:hypothetical protein [Mesorhizobium comanense]